MYAVPMVAPSRRRCGPNRLGVEDPLPEFDQHQIPGNQGDQDEEEPDRKSNESKTRGPGRQGNRDTGGEDPGDGRHQTRTRRLRRKGIRRVRIAKTISV